MTIDDYMQKIHHELSKIHISKYEDRFDEYKELIFEYIGFLKKTLNPCDMKATNQLAIACMIAQQPDIKSLNILENALEKYEKDLSKVELAELYTNLAFFCEQYHDPEYKKIYLKKAVELDYIFPQPYYALGSIYLEENDAKEALFMFKKALTLKDCPKYRYHYAVALFQNNQIHDALDIFMKLSMAWESDQIAQASLFSYGLIKGIIGDIVSAEKVKMKLLPYVVDGEIADTYDILDLLFVCNDFERYIEIFQKGNYDPKGASLYFYSIRKSRSQQELLDIYNKIMEDKQKEIKKAKFDDNSEWPANERKDFIRYVEEDIEAITSIYEDISKRDIVPTVRLLPIEFCYLIGCLRHLEE